jgi:hypothetical protein
MNPLIHASHKSWTLKTTSVTNNYFRILDIQPTTVNSVTSVECPRPISLSLGIKE